MSLVVASLEEEAETEKPYLSISERGHYPDEVYEDVAGTTSANLLRRCGAKTFYVKTSNGVDQLPYSLIRIDKENNMAIHCVLERASEEGHPIHIQMITDRHAQTH
ncbi:hypothetical protein [Croceicoccus bisphenolivorans]|uniref:hypothetical protein n=1 Tax=Croceicoccus bisphenolivorans TaxID=1783232 RepID=UPI00082E4748|nr:hypothetical protein [Croceicoccus bisphenolivorans]